MNDRHYNGWGDPCPMCQEQHEHDPNWKVQRASHGDLCPRHYALAPPHIRAVEALGMPRGPVPFLGVVDWESPVLSDWLGGKAA